MRRSSVFLLITALNLTLFLLMPLHSRRQSHGEAKPQSAQLRSLQVTDLCLATEARYTRHPAMADRHAPFQEHPLALEHFPTGSMILPLHQHGQTP